MSTTETTVSISINGLTRHVRNGISVAAALLQETRNPTLRRTPKSSAPRGIFCGIGVCFDCLVTIDGRENMRACMVTVADGMQVTTG